MSDVITVLATTTTVVNAAGELLTSLTDLAPKVAGYAAVLAAFIPPPADGHGFWASVHKWLNRIGCNFNEAANAKNREPQ
jgi:hypothetical protein